MRNNTSDPKSRVLSGTCPLRLESFISTLEEPMKRCLICLFAMLTLAFLSVAAFGQATSTGSLSGTVTDPTGAVVANATVTLRNTSTNQEFTTQTNDNGTFQIPSLATGIYSATITST